MTKLGSVGLGFDVRAAPFDPCEREAAGDGAVTRSQLMAGTYDVVSRMETRCELPCLFMAHDRHFADEVDEFFVNVVVARLGAFPSERKPAQRNDPEISGGR